MCLSWRSLGTRHPHQQSLPRYGQLVQSALSLWRTSWFYVVYVVVVFFIIMLDRMSRKEAQRQRLLFNLFTSSYSLFIICPYPRALHLFALVSNRLLPSLSLHLDQTNSNNFLKRNGKEKEREFDSIIRLLPAVPFLLRRRRWIRDISEWIARALCSPARALKRAVSSAQSALSRHVLLPLLLLFFSLSV